MDPRKLRLWLKIQMTSGMAESDTEGAEACGSRRRQALETTFEGTLGQNIRPTFGLHIHGT